MEEIPAEMAEVCMKWHRCVFVVRQAQTGRRQRGEHPGVTAAARADIGVRAQRFAPPAPPGAQRAAGHHEQGLFCSSGFPVDEVRSQRAAVGWADLLPGSAAVVSACIRFLSASPRFKASV